MVRRQHRAWFADRGELPVFQLADVLGFHARIGLCVFERERKAARKRAHLAQKPKSGEEVDEEAGTRLLQRLARRLSPEERASVESLGLISARVKMNEQRVVKTSERLVARIRMADLTAPSPQNGGAPGSQISP